MGAIAAPAAAHTYRGTNRTPKNRTKPPPFRRGELSSAVPLSLSCGDPRITFASQPFLKGACLSVLERYVCGRCFGDSGMVAYCNNYAERRKCDFCDRRGRVPIAAPLRDALRHVRECVFRHYDDPANAGLAWESAEGGYQGQTYDTDDVLDALGLDFSEDASGTLHDLVVNKLGNDLWCEIDPYGLSPIDELSYSWDHFCEIIKHRRRYFFLADDPGSGSGLRGPARVLDDIFQFAVGAGAVVLLPSGSRLYRARRQQRGQSLRSARDLGPPPVDLATQPNRMSPAGIVMTYAADDEVTALAETAYEPGTYAVGEFVTGRDVLLLDLTRLPPVPSVFEETRDTLEYDPRPRLWFLSHVSREISRPISRDDYLNIEYVPTQVVTEYVRSSAQFEGHQVEGIRYRSSRSRRGTAVVLFADDHNVVLDPTDMHGDDWLWEDRWLRLASSRKRRVTVATMLRFDK